MSDSGFGFDWISILAIIVAGGISVIKGLSKKKKGEERPVYGRPGDSYEDEEAEEEMAAEKYGDFESVSGVAAKPTFFGDYYKNIEPDEYVPEESEEEISSDFDIRQAIIASEILRRPQY